MRPRPIRNPNPRGLNDVTQRFQLPLPSCSIVRGVGSSQLMMIRVGALGPTMADWNGGVRRKRMSLKLLGLGNLRRRPLTPTVVLDCRKRACTPREPCHSKARRAQREAA